MHNPASHKRPRQAVQLNRRQMLQTLSIAGATTLIGGVIFEGKGQTNDPNPIQSFLESLSRDDGGYAWPGQDRSHLTSTFAAIGCYHCLGKTPPRKAALARFVRENHPSRLKKLEQDHREFDLQQVQSLVWLEEDASYLAPVVRGWVAPSVYLKQYERDSTPIFTHEIAAFLCRPMLKVPMREIGTVWLNYLKTRRRPNGSYNNTPASDGSGGHVVNTWYGIQAELNFHGKAQGDQQTVEWLRSCQLPSGGFTHEPGAGIANMATAACTWAAVLALKALGNAPVNVERCCDFLLSLVNEDGGFGEQPGWSSNPLSTFRALEALKSLDRVPKPDLLLRRKSGSGPGVRLSSNPVALPPNLRVFSIQIEAHGKGSPDEVVELARALRIHLWGAKNATPAWLETAQRIARENKVPVQFFVANEEYGTWVMVPGMGTYSHTSDIISPAGKDIGPSLANRPPLTWDQFRRQRLEPLRRGGGRLVWQFGENEELVHFLLADSVQRGGYSAISTYHFGNPDFTNSEPFLHQYRGKIPFIALQDAHGDEAWWFADMTTGFRTLFFGREPSWEAWLEALDRNWVVAVRRDAVSGHKLWMHAANSLCDSFARRNQADWRWWDNAHIQRPMISLVAVRPQDEFEVARPARGVTLRVRCAWENTTQGRPKKPLMEFTRLLVDGRPVIPRLVAPRLPAGGFSDYYHEYPMPNAAGEHTATAFARVLTHGGEMRHEISFSADRS